MLASTTQLNTPGMQLAELEGVHALTDVTGFGLLGHLLEICRGSSLGAAIDFDRVPVFSEAKQLCMQGIAPGAVERNWASFGEEVAIDGAILEWQRKMLCDPQTSGGLLVACAPEAESEVLELFRTSGFDHARKIGRLVEGEARIKVG